MEQIITRVKKILMTPNTALAEVKLEEINVRDFMKQYVAIVAAIPAAAHFIGLIGRQYFLRILVFVVLFYGMSLVTVFVFGKIIDALAPTFGAVKNDLNAFKLATYAYTPYFIAGIAFINPSLSFLTILGLIYGLYIFYLGITTLMEAPQEKAVLYAAAAIVINVIVMFILWMIAVTLAGVSSGGPFRYYW